MLSFALTVFAALYLFHPLIYAATLDPAPTLTPVLTPAPAPIAYSSSQDIHIDDKLVPFQMYALRDSNGNDTNYIRIRDLALALDNTKIEFSLEWRDNTVYLLSGMDYVANGSENQTPFVGDQTYESLTSPVNVNHVEVNLDGFLLTDHQGGGYTYYRLRDLGKALDFNIRWDADTGIHVETTLPYTDNN